MKAALVLAVLITTAAQAAPPRLVSPHDLLASYMKNEVAADLEFKGKPIELFGVIAKIGKDPTGRVFVSLDTGDALRSARCYFPKREAGKIAKLARGQLVAIEGKARGFVMESPILDCTHVAWTAPEETEQLPLLVARSTEACALELLHDALRTQAADEHKHLTKAQQEAAFAKFDAEIREEQPQAIQMIEQAKAEIAQAQVTPIPCTDPVVRSLARCEDDPSAPECQTDLVKSAIEQLQH